MKENTPNIPVTQEETTKVQTPLKPKFPFLLVGIIVLVTTILTLLGVYLYFFFTQEKTDDTKTGDQNNNQDTDTDTNTEVDGDLEEDKTDTDTEEEVVSALDGQIFHAVDGKGIYSYNINTGVNTKILTANVKDSYVDINVIDDNTLGFSRCRIKTGDFGCGLYTLNLTTKAVTTVKTISKSLYLMASDFFNATTYAYLTDGNSKWQVSLVKNGVSTYLTNLSYTDGYGRGGYEEDSQKIRFSDDGANIFYVTTSSPENVTDFNVKVYNTTTFAKETIKTATQPDWLTNTKIVYRKVGDGLYIYNINTNVSKKVGKVSQYAFNPMVAKGDDKILYTNRGTTTNKKLYVYDVSDNTLTLANNKSVDGLWVNLTNIVYNKIGACTVECGFSDYETKGVATKNLSTSVIKNIAPIEDTYGVATVLDH